MDVVGTDLSLITTDTPTTEEEILESAQLGKKEYEANGNEIFDAPVAKPTAINVGNALETIQNLCLFNKKKRVRCKVLCSDSSPCMSLI